MDLAWVIIKAHAVIVLGFIVFAVLMLELAHWTYRLFDYFRPPNQHWMRQ